MFPLKIQISLSAGLKLETKTWQHVSSQGIRMEINIHYSVNLINIPVSKITVTCNV